MILQTKTQGRTVFLFVEKTSKPLILLIRTRAPNDGGQYVNSYNTRARLKFLRWATYPMVPMRNLKRSL